MVINTNIFTPVFLKYKDKSNKKELKQNTLKKKNIKLIYSIYKYKYYKAIPTKCYQLYF